MPHIDVLFQCKLEQVQMLCEINLNISVTIVEHKLHNIQISGLFLVKRDFDHGREQPNPFVP